MHTRTLNLAAALCAVLAVCRLGGQTTEVAKPAPAETPSLADAVNRRTQIVEAVLSGERTTGDAIEGLKSLASPSGLKIDGDADFALAALDVGRRLLALHRPADAETFFRAAEQSLSLVIDRTADTAVREKSQYLQVRATIRANYLNKSGEARADFDAALKLVPDDHRLQQMRRLIPADPATTIQNHKELPTRG